MKELSLNILDIAENSVKAGATLIKIAIDETSEIYNITISDDGCGMENAVVSQVTDPFFTTRTTRKVGLGIPLFKMEAELTGGVFEIDSKTVKDFPKEHGTKITATFYKNHIDCTPLGDITATMVTLVQGHADIDFHYLHKFSDRCVELDTRQLREVLGSDVPLCEYEVIKWIEEFLKEQYINLYINE